jgi:hypothetical protein
MRVWVNNNSITADTVFTLLVNGSSVGTPTVTLGSGITTGSDLTTTIAVVAGDRLSVKIVTGASGTTIQTPCVSVEETAA